MKETGVIRRIDELGRIVIPKEIRRRLNINFQDQIDIFTNSNEIVLKKYEPVQEMIKPINKMVNAFIQDSKLNIVVFDDTKVVASSCDMYEIDDLLDKSFINIVKGNDNYELSSLHDYKITNFNNDKNCYIKRILSDAKFAGFVLIISKDIISKGDREKANMIAYFISQSLLEIV